jgi:hypothetical protein
MRSLTRNRAEALGIPSREAAKALIDANPPDKGWEGPPFDGSPPSGIGDSIAPELQPIGDVIEANGGTVASNAEVAEILRCNPGEAGNITPEGALGPAKKAEEVFAMPTGLPDTPTWDKDMLEVRKELQKDICASLVEAKYLKSGATVEDMDRFILDLMKDVYRLSWKDPDVALRHYSKLNIIDTFLENRSKINVKHPFYEIFLRHADTLKFLTFNQVLAFNYHTQYGDQMMKKILAGKKESPAKMALGRKYYRVLNLIANSFNRRIVRPEKELFRHTDSYMDDTGKRELLDVVKEFMDWNRKKTGSKPSSRLRFKLTTSFSEVRGKAENFPGPIMFRLVTDKGIPIAAARAFRDEAEQLIMNGTVIEIERVEYTPEKITKLVSKSEEWLVDIVISDDQKKWDYEFAA